MLDVAQALQGAAQLLANAKYATAAAINAAAAAVDVSKFVQERALIAILNEDTTATTTLAIQHSDTSGGTYTDVDADVLSDPVTGTQVALSDLNAKQFQLIGINTGKIKRYLKITATTDPTTVNGAAINALFLGCLRHTA